MPGQKKSEHAKAHHKESKDRMVIQRPSPPVRGRDRLSRIVKGSHPSPKVAKAIHRVPG